MNDLNTNGCVFLKSVYNKENMNKILNDFIDFYIRNNIQEDLNKREDVTNQNSFINNTYSLLNSYEKMQHFYVPVFNNRLGMNRITDIGLIDVFNIQKIIFSIQEIINIELMLNILRKLTNEDWKFLRTNLQIHNHVKNPNQYHFSDKEIIKISIFLSDVYENEGGGFSYILGSHKNKKISNHFKNFYGNKGDIFIQYQNGYHKKLNQNPSVHFFLELYFIKK